MSKGLSKKAVETWLKLRSMPRGKLIATAGLGLFLFSWATQGHKKYKATNANKGQG